MRRVVLIVLALIVLAPTAAQAAALYRCLYDGQVRKSCCCPPKAKDKPDRHAPVTVRASSCCKVTTLEAPAPSARDTAPAQVTSVPPAVEAVTIAVAPPARPVRRAPVVAFVPTGPPDPLFVRNCTLLL